MGGAGVAGADAGAVGSAMDVETSRDSLVSGAIVHPGSKPAPKTKVRAVTYQFLGLGGKGGNGTKVLAKHIVPK